jgi:hypothetical protein
MSPGVEGRARVWIRLPAATPQSLPIRSTTAILGTIQRELLQRPLDTCQVVPEVRHKTIAHGKGMSGGAVCRQCRGEAERSLPGGQAPD